MPDVENFFTQRRMTISAAKSSVTVFMLEFNRHPAIIGNVPGQAPNSPPVDLWLKPVAVSAFLRLPNTTSLDSGGDS
ncbi:unnamed protein product [Dibothriocephalus latus]|uniref:Uncharacterized protein n=1 Tax=Dibothriocephalus latus TaxID=60516 RepID=A0A3P7NU70_DIBLA|nr:unnamed protein product [Dibothriocephalus latus]